MNVAEVVAGLDPVESFSGSYRGHVPSSLGMFVTAREERRVANDNHIERSIQGRELIQNRASSSGG